MTLDYFYGQAGKLFSFYRIPKALFQEQRFQNLSTDAKTLYGILLDCMSLSVKNEWFDKQGRVFIIFTIEDVKRALCCADNKATKLLRELENFGLIERKRRGQGKPCLVYVKNFSSESSKESVKNRDNHDSCGSKIACQDPVKSRGIKKKENKTEMNNTNLILSNESEKMKNRELLEEYFSHSLEIDLLLRLYPDDEDPFCKEDIFVEVSDEIVEAFLLDKRAEAARDRKMFRYKAFYSLDCNDGIENAAIGWAQPSPEDYLIEKEELAEYEELIRRLYEAISSLPPMQARRVHARYMLGMKVKDIAAMEGITPSQAGKSIHAALRRLRRYFARQKWTVNL